MRIFSLILIGVLIFGCKKKEPPKSPESARLAFPDANSECTTGQSINATTSKVEFRWLAAESAETYELRVTNLNTNITQTISAKGLSATLPIEKGAPFSWLVRSRNSKVNETASSEIWRFYNAGFQTTYAPFPTMIIAPELAESVFKDINNDVILKWSGADVDDDIVGYELYFSIETPPNTLIASPSPDVTDTKVSVTSNTVYYWKVLTKDSEGNTSDSGIFEFKVL
ncbi:MAG: hypothetical protein QM485_04440 [Flavobacteriaceae bacterium]